MKKALLINIIVFITSTMFAQNTVTGVFSDYAGQEISLVGFSGFDTYIINSTTANAEGTFSLSFSEKDCGMAMLVSEDNLNFLVVLAENEDLKLKGKNFADTENVEIVNGRQNKVFAQYATEHPLREEALNAWSFLEQLYEENAIFAKCKDIKQAIIWAQAEIKGEEEKFLILNTSSDDYIGWYLPMRKLVSSVPAIAQYRTDEIPEILTALRNIDYCDNRLQKSGLLKSLIENHFWLIENSGQVLDSVYEEMNISIDCVVDNLLKDEAKLNAVSEYLFKFLEKRSLFGASEYLALRLLNEQGCTLNNDFAAQLESCRSMKVGNVAPDFSFKSEVVAPNYAKVPKKLSEISSQYVLLVFGASWCPQCPQELLQVTNLYGKWKSQGVEVVFVSLDENETAFRNFTEIFPFISLCDFRKWDSPIVEKYHVFATPTFYLLDNERKIVLRPNSASQMDSWVDWYLVKGGR